MSSRAGVVAGAVIGSAIALVFLVRTETPSVVPADSPSASRAAPVPVVTPAREGIAVTEGREPAPALPAAEPQQPHAPLPGATPLTPISEAPARGVPTFVAANEQSFSRVPIVAEWAAEPIDTEWASGAETDIFSKFAEQAGLELIALQVECRTTMCLVQMTQPGSASDDPPARLLSSLGMQPRFIMRLAGEPGMQTSVAYLMRPGFALPQIPAHGASPPNQAAGAPRE